jgi:hypothetical protein
MYAFPIVPVFVAIESIATLAALFWGHDEISVFEIIRVLLLLAGSSMLVELSQEIWNATIVQIASHFSILILSPFLSLTVTVKNDDRTCVPHPRRCT